MNGTDFEPEQHRPSHAVYDRTTGRVLATYRRLDVKTGKMVPDTEDEVLDLVRGDESLVAETTDGDPGNLATLVVEAERAPAAAVRVAPERGRLVVPPRIRLMAERDELEGDGEDSLEISIDIVDASDKPVGDYRGPVHVSTSRGRLSARGGDLELDDGRGKLALTSVRETVDEVTVRATVPDGSLVPGELTVRFL
jgi:hypothetical protein